jgi:hypothetical protein
MRQISQPAFSMDAFTGKIKTSLFTTLAGKRLAIAQSVGATPDIILHHGWGPSLYLLALLK